MAPQQTWVSHVTASFQGHRTLGLAAGCPSHLDPAEEGLELHLSPVPSGLLSNHRRAARGLGVGQAHQTGAAARVGAGQLPAQRPPCWP